MITYAKPATRTVPAKNSRPERKPQLAATWHSVNGKLVCRWVPVRSFLEQ